jgi:SNF2 family DNA or RNA helicase
MAPSSHPQPEDRDLILPFPGELNLRSLVAEPLDCRVRELRTRLDSPTIRSLGKPVLTVTTRGWSFPATLQEPTPVVATAATQATEETRPSAPGPQRPFTRLKPPRDAVLFKDRLLYLLQPPLEAMMRRRVTLSCKPYPYQMDGIAFLMPRHAALIADEMGLGKTMQVLLALRLLFQAGLISSALIVCPKPLVVNWTRELRAWAEDLPFEVITGDTDSRRTSWLVSNCPVKLVNYEIVTRDADLITDDCVQFDVVIADEAQRIKTKDSKTAQAVRSIHRRRSWAMTGTPVENRVDDLVNIFEFVDSGRIPPDTPVRQLPQFTADCIIRRTKEQVVSDIPAKVIKDVYLELSAPQRQAYDLAENQGVVYLDSIKDRITVQHVFELVMRLKQICNFDPATTESSKVEQLEAEIAEVAECGRKAIVFSQWVEPLEYLSTVLAPYGAVQYHGRVPFAERQGILDRFRNDANLHVMLMSYGTGSVGLNLQCANYVFLFDRWWNPAVEDQAVNRTHRIGQKDPVFVYRFLVQNTIEERIAEVLERKRQLFHELIEQNGAPPSLGLSQAEIFGLFEIQGRPKMKSQEMRLFTSRSDDRG